MLQQPSNLPITTFGILANYLIPRQPGGYVLPSAQIVSLPAQQMTNQQRKDIALQVISNKASVTDIANHHGVSRKFVYQQKDKSIEAVDQAFEEASYDNDGFVANIQQGRKNPKLLLSLRS